MRVGKSQQAAQVLRKILRQLPQHPQANSQLGLLLLRSGQAEAAVPYLRRACESQPKVMWHWLRLLSACQQSGNTTESKAVLSQASRYSWSAEVMTQLAKVAHEPPAERQRHLVGMYQSKQDPLTTEIAARMFMEDYPEHPLGWQVLGSLLHDAGQFDQAITVQREATQLFPRDPNVHNNLAFTLLALKRYAEALTSAQAALTLNPQLVQAQEHARLAQAGLAADAPKATHIPPLMATSNSPT